MLFAANPRLSWMFAAGIALITMVLMRRIWRLRGRRRSVPQRQPVKRSASRLLDAPSEVGVWQVEMHELARELRAELDTKIRVCQETIRQARLEQQRLNELLERARQIS